MGNRAQRCDCHKLAGFWWVGGVWSCVQIMSCGHFGSRTILCAILKEDHGLFSARAPSANGGVWRLAQGGSRHRATSWNRHPLCRGSVVPFAPGVSAAVHRFLRGLLPVGNTFMNVMSAYDALMFGLGLEETYGVEAVPRLPVGWSCVQRRVARRCCRELRSTRDGVRSGAPE